MARSRYKNWGLVGMARGDSPAWPLPDVQPKFAEWSFGGERPFGCEDNCTRWHAGIDLVQAPDKALVVATERMTIVGVDRGWSKGSKAVTGHTETGLFLVFGGTIRGSGKEFGIAEGMTVDKGQPIGRVKGSYGMIHFETYSDPGGNRMSNTSWPIGQEPPAGLLNPLNYVQAAAGRPITIANWAQRRAALRELGFYPADQGPWGASDIDATVEAQAHLSLEADGIWGPATDDKIRDQLGYTDGPIDIPVGTGAISETCNCNNISPGTAMLGAGIAMLGLYAIARRV